MNIIDLVRNEVKDLLKNDPAHDFQHVLRVYRNAEKICAEEIKHRQVWQSNLMNNSVALKS